MPIDALFFSTMDGWAQNQVGTQTEDFEIPPSTIYATATLTGLATTNDGNMWSGIVEYRKRDPKTGKDQVHIVGDISSTLDLPGAVFDTHVDSVTFGLGVNDYGEGNFTTSAFTVHQILVFD